MGSNRAQPLRIFRHIGSALYAIPTDLQKLKSDGFHFRLANRSQESLRSFRTNPSRKSMLPMDLRFFAFLFIISEGYLLVRPSSDKLKA